MASDPGYEVLFMPWAGLGQTYKLGPFSFVPWSKMERVAPEIKAYLDPYFQRHVDHFGRPVKSITLLIRDGRDFSCDAYLSHERPSTAVDAMFFAIAGPTVAAAVSDDNDGLAPPTADAFDLIRQNFRAGDSDVMVRSGGSGHLAKISALIFSQPWDLGGTAWFPCDELLEGLGKLFDPSFESEDPETSIRRQKRDAIFRSLEWFRLAHKGDEATSDFARVVMMSTAFEILLDFPDYLKRQHFIDVVDRCLRLPDSIVVKVRGPNNQEREVCAAASWAGDFYNLRNKVVHGDNLILEQLRFDRWLTHQIVADVVFCQCVKHELFDLELVGHDIRDTRAGPHGEQLAPMLENQFFGYDTHRTLKWTT